MPKDIENVILDMIGGRGSVLRVEVKDEDGERRTYPVRVMDDGTLRMVRPHPQDDKR